MEMHKEFNQECFLYIPYQVKDDFDKVYQKSHEMQRDQPILPVYLEDHNLTQDVSVVSRQQLIDIAQFQKISGHKFMDLWADHG